MKLLFNFCLVCSVADKKGAAKQPQVGILYALDFPILWIKKAPFRRLKYIYL